MAIRLLIVTDKYPIDADRSPAAWMLDHLQALEGVADVTVISLVRLLPRMKNLLFGGYDRRWFRIFRNLPDEAKPFPHVTVYHRRCVTVPDSLGWKINPQLYLWQQRGWLRRLLQQTTFDAVLLHYVHGAASLARMAATVAHAALLVDVNEGMDSLQEERQSTLHRWITAKVKEADVIIAQCSVQKEDLQQAFAGKSVQLVSLGNNDVAFAATPPDPAPLRCICVSRLDLRSKHVDRLVKAAASLRHEDGTDLQLTIAGDGFLRSELLRLAEELGISTAVRFTGWLPQSALRTLLHEQHFAVQPSQHESFGLTALEAASAGLPLIAGARTGVVPDLASEGAALRLLNECTVEEITEALRDLRDRLPEMQRQAIEARGRIHERFSWSSHAQQYLAVFNALKK